MRYGTQKHLDYLKKRLEQKCRTKKTVSVEYLEDLSKAFGKPPGHRKRLGCTFIDSKVFIFIEKKMSFEIKAQTLVHEWAHAMTPTYCQDHGRKWAENYAKAYYCVFRVL